jgi:putative photosynthetic complex assembly protein 2
MESFAFTELGLPVLFALFLWWFSTGLVLMLDGLRPAATRWSLGIASALAALAVWGIHGAARIDSVWAAYAGFVLAIVVWGWQELAFLTGWITGTRRRACAPGATGFRRFAQAVEAIVWHELSIAAAGLAVIAASWGGPNQTAAWTFLVLWVMRVSAKLNLFLGVRNTGAELLPDRLRYLESYFAQRPMNLLFPVSVTAATVVTVLIIQRALGPHETPATSAGLMLAGGLLALAVVEHWMMVLPVRVSALWEWAMRTHRRGRMAKPLAGAGVVPPRG